MIYLSHLQCWDSLLENTSLHGKHSNGRANVGFLCSDSPGSEQRAYCFRYLEVEAVSAQCGNAGRNESHQYFSQKKQNLESHMSFP